MAVQTTYPERMSPPSPGTIQGSDYDTETGICETEDGIPFGRAVSVGDESDQGVVLGGDATKFRGCSVKDITLVASSSENVDKFMPPNSLSILHRGTIWVEPGTAVAANDAVTFDASTGIFSNSGGVTVKDARWKTSCDEGGRAVLQLGGANRDS